MSSSGRSLASLKPMSDTSAREPYIYRFTCVTMTKTCSVLRCTFSVSCALMFHLWLQTSEGEEPTEDAQCTECYATLLTTRTTISQYSPTRQLPLLGALTFWHVVTAQAKTIRFRWEAERCKIWCYVKILVLMQKVVVPQIYEVKQAVSNKQHAQCLELFLLENVAKIMANAKSWNNPASLAGSRSHTGPVAYWKSSVFGVHVTHGKHHVESNGHGEYHSVINTNEILTWHTEQHSGYRLQLQMDQIKGTCWSRRFLFPPKHLFVCQ